MRVAPAWRVRHARPLFSSVAIKVGVNKSTCYAKPQQQIGAKQT